MRSLLIPEFDFGREIDEEEGKGVRQHFPRGTNEAPKPAVAGDSKTYGKWKTVWKLRSVR
jgi:hypothetical protein